MPDNKIVRTWSNDFDDPEPEDRPALVDPNGWRWWYEPDADAWVNDHEDEEGYEWSAALFEVRAFREVSA